MLLNIQNESTRQPVTFTYSYHWVFSVDVTIKLMWQLLFTPSLTTSNTIHHDPIMDCLFPLILQAEKGPPSS